MVFSELAFRVGVGFQGVLLFDGICKQGMRRRGVGESCLVLCLIVEEGGLSGRLLVLLGKLAWEIS